jgi:hypothetical protein
LNAEGAFFHDSAHADGNVWVVLEVERRWPCGIEPIEEPHGIRAVIGAVAGSDAAVINLNIQPFRILIGGINGADWLARSFVTVLAEHRHVLDTDIREFPFVITVDADPMNSATRSG